MSLFRVFGREIEAKAFLVLLLFLIATAVVPLPLNIIWGGALARRAVSFVSIFMGLLALNLTVILESDLASGYRKWLHGFPSMGFALIIGSILIPLCFFSKWLVVPRMLVGIAAFGSFPILSYLWQITKWKLALVLLILSSVMATVTIEAICLSFYSMSGTNMSAIHTLHQFPRVFVNIRDGNQILIAGYWLAFFSAFWVRKFCASPLLFFSVAALASFPFWFLAYLTAGRGAILSLLIFVAFLIVKSFGRGLTDKHKVWFKLALLGNVLASVSSFYCSYVLSKVNLFSSVSARTVVSLSKYSHGELFGYSGRIGIWGNWLSAWISSKQSFWGGLGWGGAPPPYPNPVWSFDAHSIYVQVICEGGVFGALLMLVGVYLIAKSASANSFFAKYAHWPDAFVYAFFVPLTIYQGLDRFWAMPWGLAMFLVSAPLLLTLKCKHHCKASQFSCFLLGSCFPALAGLCTLYLIFRPPL